jgi:hypothetical protein
MGILDVPSYSRSAVDALVTAAPRTVRPKGNKVVAIGDSHTFNNNGLWLRTICALSGGRALYGGHWATGGFTLQQIRDTHLPTVLALTGNQKPAACVVFGGTNNAIAGGGATDGTAFNFATSRAALADITTALEAAGIVVILITVPPRGVYDLANQNVKRWNAYIQSLGAARGWPVLNFHDALANSNGGYWLAGLSDDEIHANGLGNGTMVRSVSAQFINMFAESRPYLSTGRTDNANLIPAGSQVFYADSNTDGIADGWSQALVGSGGQLFTLTPYATNVGGNWQSLAAPAGSGGQACLKTLFTTGYTAGDRLAFAARIKAVGFEANPGQSYYVRLDFNGGAGLISSLSMVTTVSGGSSDIADGVAYVEGVVPAGTTGINVTLMVQGPPVSGTGAVLTVALPTVTNLTQLGI